MVDLVMDWSNDLILYFLQLYREEPCLWDPTDKNYKRKDMISAAWKRLSDSTKKPVFELKRKKESLMATFRNYSRRKRNSLAGAADREKVYEPVWFAYSAMEDFLGGMYITNTQDTANVENEPSENTDQQSEDLDFPNNLVSTSPGTVQPTLKRRRRAIETEDNQDFSTKGDDEECDLYGKILAKKLRRIPVWERQLLMYRIDGMIINTMEQNGLMPTETFHKGRTSHVSAQSLTEERLEEMLDGDSKAGITLYSDA